MECKLLLVTLILSLNISDASILNWLGWGRKVDDANVLVADGVPLISIPYESMTEDEKFLQEAAKFMTDIQVSSPLEICQHKVIMKLRTSCSDMTEEELAKLSVNLLNCQSAVEGRKMFPCTEEMSLKQCTIDMDADMWNAYHLISNRARAVCYAARNTQFRALTELTVNKLMQSAHSQIEALNSLKQGQDRLEEKTEEAVSSLTEGHKVLLTQQENLKDAQVTAQKLVTTNLRELYNEKALIRSGHAQLAAMTEEIKNKLEKAHYDLEQQAIERGENHQEVLQDLLSIQEQARMIWEKIEHSTNHILEQHEETIHQYEQTMQMLTQINDTIQYIWNLTNTMRVEVDQKLGWITEYIGDTGEQMQKAYRIFLHIMYLLVAMIIAAFLQTPFLTRATIMGVVPANLFTYLKHGMEASLDFTSVTVLIFLITAMHFIMLGIQRIIGPNTSKAKIELIKLIQQKNLNGVVNDNTTLSNSSESVPTMQLHKRLAIKIQELYNSIVSQINYYRGKLQILLESVSSWGGRNLNAHEELSCSYQPSRKMREDIVHNGLQHPNFMMKRLIECDSSDDTPKLINEMQYEDNFIDHHNHNRTDFNISEKSFEPVRRNTNLPRSRSGTPVSLRFPCMGITRNGRRCRALVSPGQNYCYHHSTGTSVNSVRLN
ncbi:protein brambleberry [Monomorium pharaonis]|uniref:protein brambleberry n=1 Tax=Monomorium pharaonis TaxID=307658 RepID=UPI00063FBCF9|nr:protein brambleberry [Monomorium pharaonis]XP_012536414.1 protein brambleberry [Monomorium pharaonis]XP_012536415.1 protein brambleberry [Monomorium pharaonis]XP_028048987.1 protein brambleberry [Monomorium pharaonis]